MGIYELYESFTNFEAFISKVQWDHVIVDDWEGMEY